MDKACPTQCRILTCVFPEQVRKLDDPLVHSILLLRRFLHRFLLNVTSMMSIPPLHHDMLEAEHD